LAVAGPRDVVLYSDEVDIHLNPKVGPDWTPAGQRKMVVTPGKNEKNYLAGAWNPVTGTLVAVEGERKTSDLFIDLLRDLARRYRLHGTVHLVVDNCSIHHSKKTQKAMEALGGKIVLHFLPPYCPHNNPIERVWLDLHIAITRNHKHATIEELMVAVRVWLKHYSGQGARYANTALVACA
jgi:transposase